MKIPLEYSSLVLLSCHSLSNEEIIRTHMQGYKIVSRTVFTEWSMTLLKRLKEIITLLDNIIFYSISRKYLGITNPERLENNSYFPRSQLYISKEHVEPIFTVRLVEHKSSNLHKLAPQVWNYTIYIVLYKLSIISSHHYHPNKNANLNFNRTFSKYACKNPKS